ncbi:MAG: type II toxin-antitoxin system RelE/ParE family toxin [Planctomycetota bacterium]|nr:type II toxin-antitoxin system RelE/ParE family toxin [Planctomycetota bacterium]
MNIRILPEAEHDLELGADFYESQREGLGRYFNDCLMADIESLRIYAGVHERVHDLYRSLSKRFPFAIFYDTSPDTIDIYAVLDCRQDPQKIEERLNSPRENS